MNYRMPRRLPNDLAKSLATPAPPREFSGVLADIDEICGDTAVAPGAAGLADIERCQPAFAITAQHHVEHAVEGAPCIAEATLRFGRKDIFHGGRAPQDAALILAVSDGVHLAGGGGGKQRHAAIGDAMAPRKVAPELMFGV